MNLNEAVEKQGFSGKNLYTGFGTFEVLTVNPNEDEIRKIYGLKEDSQIREPNYQIRDDLYKVEFWCKYLPTANSLPELIENPLIVRYTVFVNNEEVVSKDGSKKQFVNHENKSFYYRDIKEIEQKNDLQTEDWKKFSLEGIRVSKKGEVELMDFIVNLFNLDRKKNKLEFDNFSKICNGNVNELKDYINQAKEKQKSITLLLGVKDGMYQDVLSTTLPVNFSFKMKEKVTKEVSNIYQHVVTFNGLELFNKEEAPEEVEMEKSPFDETTKQGFDNDGKWVGQEPPKKQSLF